MRALLILGLASIPTLIHSGCTDRTADSVSSRFVACEVEGDSVASTSCTICHCV